MSETTKTKRERLVTPVATVQYAFIDRPRMNYKKTGHEYSLTARIPGATGKPIYDALVTRSAKVMEKALAEAKDGKEKKAIRECKLTTFISPEIDKDGEETGNFTLNVKQAATIKLKAGGTREITIPQIDAKKNSVTKSNLGPGSKVRVAVDLNDYCTPGSGRYGVSGWLVGVQILELVKYNGNGDMSSVFDEAEGFTVGEGDDAPFSDSEAAAAPTDKGNGDF